MTRIKARLLAAALWVLPAVAFSSLAAAAGSALPIGSSDGLPPAALLAEPPMIRLLASPGTGGAALALPAEVEPAAKAAGDKATTISVDFLPGGTIVGSDLCGAWPEQAKIAFGRAASIWASLVHSPVIISINACWAVNMPSGELAHGRDIRGVANFPGAPLAYTWYPIALANAIYGADIVVGQSEIYAAFNAGTAWYLGTDGRPGTSQDFVTAAVKMIAHGLGFRGTMSVNSGLGAWGALDSGYLLPYVYDRFTENSAGQKLLDTALFPNPSGALAVQLLSPMYFNGPTANSANGSARVPLYSPNVWSQGASYSHLGEAFRGTRDELMTIFQTAGTAIHTPGPVTLGILADLGWQLLPGAYRRLTLEISGGGTVSVTPWTGAWGCSGGICAKDFLVGPLVKLVPIAAPGHVFMGITFDRGLNCTRILPDQTSCYFVLSEATKVKARFAGPIPDFISVVRGYEHACGLTRAGGVKCWGTALHGEIGVGQWIGSNEPVDVVGLTSGVAAISGGGMTTCALTTGGQVKCWGGNWYGSVGDGANIDRPAPVDTGLSGIWKIAGDGYVNCAISAAGEAYCWGENISGQLRGGSISRPTLVPGLTGERVIDIATNGSTACVVVTPLTPPPPGTERIGGGVKCWGHNEYGQLGNGTTSTVPASVPTSVFGLSSGVTQVAVGMTSAFALVSPGTVMGWGQNAGGEIGDGTTSPRLIPTVAQNAAAGIASLSGNCVLTLQGAVRCTRMGNGSVLHENVPGFASGVAALSVFWDSLLCAVMPNGTIKCNGSSNSTGQLGLACTQAPCPPEGTTIIGMCVDPHDCDRDGIPDHVEAAQGSQPVAKDNDVFGNSRLFAMQQYRDFLGREGDPPGVAGWMGLVDAGTYPRARVIDAFLNSQEFAGFVAPVVRLYFAAFLRVPDFEGLTYNAGLVRSGTVTLAQLADFFAASPEFQSRYGSLTHAQFVTLLYSNVLGRAPDSGGLAGWVNLLNTGTSRGQVLLGFSDSPEYQAAMAHEVFVTMMYAGMLRRTPEPSGFSGWVGFLDAGTYTREQVINGFFLSTEYRARFLP